LFPDYWMLIVVTLSWFLAQDITAIKLLNKERIFKNTFTTTQQGFLIRTRPHRVCHPH